MFNSMETSLSESEEFSCTELLTDPLENKNVPQSQSNPKNNRGKKSDRKWKEKAVWDPFTSAIWIDICVDEVRAGNRPGTHFTKIGWRHVIEKFTNATGRYYNKAQHKNRWDVVKKDWQLWQSLVKGESGLGWDTVKQTVDATEDWWESKIKKFSDAAKFRYKGLEHKEKLDILFSDGTTTVENTWALSSGVLPTDMQIYDIGDSSNFPDIQNDDDSFLPNLDEIMINVDDESVSTKSRKRSRDGSSRSKKENKPYAKKLVSTLDQIAEAVGKNKVQSISLDKPGSSIPEVLELVEELPGVNRGDGLYMLATELFLQQQYREMFVALPEPGLRFAWLKRLEKRF